MPVNGQMSSKRYGIEKYGYLPLSLPAYSSSFRYYGMELHNQTGFHLKPNKSEKFQNHKYT